MDILVAIQAAMVVLAAAAAALAILILVLAAAADIVEAKEELGTVKGLAAAAVQKIMAMHKVIFRVFLEKAMEKYLLLIPLDQRLPM